MIESAIFWILDVLSLPVVGLPSVFFISFISATLLPLGSEPALFAVVKANAALFWPAILVGTAGNTLGGMVGYWMGYGAKKVAYRQYEQDRRTRWFGWLVRFGPKVMLLSWIPGIGDPLCVLAGWLKLRFWPCVIYMAIGKFLRYLLMTWALLHIPDGFWQWLLGFF